MTHTPIPATIGGITEIGGPGSVAGVPHLPDGFTDTFSSRLVDVGEVRLHAVIGGDGPPLLLVGGWPQTWYAWRLVMPELARHHAVVAVDLRGIGRSDKPSDGYDTGTLAGDLLRLMSALGHERFGVVGHDVGMWVGHALAADHPEAVARLVVAEAVVPGLTPSAPLLGTSGANDRLWHFAFNRLEGLNELLVSGREEIFFGHQFATKAAVPLPAHAIDVYVDAVRDDPVALRSSFAFYRAIDETIAQNERRRAVSLAMPVLAIGGGENLGPVVAQTMRAAAPHAQEAVLAGCGHYPAEETPAEFLAEVTRFLAPYRRSEG